MPSAETVCPRFNTLGAAKQHLEALTFIMT